MNDTPPIRELKGHDILAVQRFQDSTRWMIEFVVRKRKNEAVVALGKLALEHLGILGPDAVKGIILGRDENALFKALHAGTQVQERKLEPNGAVKVIEEVAPRIENGAFVLILGELIVDVLELDGLGIKAVRHAAHAVRPHPFIGNGILGRLLVFIRPLCPFDGGGDLFALGAGQLSF